MTTMPHVTGGRRTLFTLLVALASLGCEGPVESTDASLLGAPDWVTRGCAGASNRICGVGSAAGMPNHALRRTAAIGRARTEIARSLQSRVVSMLKDYSATTTGEGDFGLASADDQHLVDVSKQVTNVTLAGTEVLDTWVSPDKTFYALVTLDVAKFSDTVSRMSQLSDGVRDAIVERADEAFREPDTDWSRR